MYCMEAAFGDYIKSCILPGEMDAMSVICLHAAETGASEDIYITLESVNGNWRVNNDHLTLQSSSRDLCVGKPVRYIYTGEDRELIITLYIREFSSPAVIYNKFAITSGKDITIGRTVSSCICLKDATDENIAAITYEDNNFVINRMAETKVYVNRQLINRHPLKFFDQVYIEGIQLIFLGVCLAVNEIDHRVVCTLPSYDPALPDTSITDPVSVEEKLFFRSPRIFKKILPKTLEIDTPPQPKKQRFTPFMLQVGASVSMGAVMVLGLVIRMASGSGNTITTIISAITILGSLIGMVVFPKKVRSFQQKRSIKDEEARRSAYIDYLLEQEKILSDHQSSDSAILAERYPNLQAQADRIRFTQRQLWERSPKNDDFLDVRFGIGRRESYHKALVAEEGFAIEKDPLWAEAKKLEKKYRVITQIPISLELTKEIIVGIIGHRVLCIDILKSILIQIVASHSYNDVKIIYLCDKHDTSLDSVRWFPHVWDDNRNFRFITHDNASLNEILDTITPNLNERKELKENSSKEEIFIPHFVVVCTSEQLLKNETLQGRFLNSYDNINGIGLSFIIVARTIDGLPLFCNTIIQCTDEHCGVYRATDPSNLVYLFKPDNISSLDLPVLSRRLFGTRTLDINENRLLPDTLSFLGMYKVSTIEELRIEERWQTNSSEFNIRGYIGVTASSNFLLDIHEKAHGPHGLIAGTTGSGKSEFIQSFILSLAVNYHPHDISFIIIDYKGGGTAQAFRNLPHMAGYITNLDGNQIRRSLVTLEVELSRRQKLFALYDVNHIDKYQRLYKEGKADTPLPHLIIVADEFAELKQSRSDFMDKLVSMARIGRSLGVHLILATQRPTGVVNEQILSNTRFRVCLKVADKSDSREMLKRDEAADIINVGRAYVLIGNNEIFTALQTGWSGAAYYEGDRRKVLNRIAVHLLDDNGRVCLTEETENRQTNKDAPTQLQAVVNALAGLANQKKLAPIRLWADSLENKIYLEDIVPKTYFDGHTWQSNPVWPASAVGVLDDVSSQKRRTLTVDFGNNGHVALFGQAGSGKSSFMQTLVYSLAQDYAPDRVNIYILDCEGRSTGYYKILPHVGDVVFLDEDLKFKKLFMMIDQTILDRQILMESKDCPDIKTYTQTEKKTLPAIVLIIRNLAAFTETSGDLYDEKINALARDGAKYGIYLVFIANTVTDLKSKIQQNVGMRFCLQLSNPYEYINALGKTDGLEPDSRSGRGLAKQKYVMEFQTALAIKNTNTVDPDEEDLYRIQLLRSEFSTMRSAWLDSGRKVAPTIPVIPKLYTVIESLKTEAYQEKLDECCIPIGYDLADIELACVDLNNIWVYPVVGGSKTGKTNFIKTLIHLFSRINSVSLYVIDNFSHTLLPTVAKIKNINYAATEDEINITVRKLMDIGIGRNQEYKANKNTYFPPIVILVDDFHNFYKKLADSNVKVISDLMKDGKKLGFTQFISIGKREEYTGESIINNLFMYDQGILLGGNYNTYSYFTTSMDYKKREAILEVGTAYCFDNGKYIHVKTPLAD